MSAPAAWRLHLANVILHPSLAKGLRGPLLDVRDAAILASHAVTPRAQELLRQGDVDGFFAARAETLRAHVEDFVARCAGWDRTDRPPLSALEIADED